MTRRISSRRARSALLLSAMILSLALALSSCAYMTIEQQGVTVIGRDAGTP